jgi:hypothetical protein
MASLYATLRVYLTRKRLTTFWPIRSSSGFLASSATIALSIPIARGLGVLLKQFGYSLLK